LIHLSTVLLRLRLVPVLVAATVLSAPLAGQSATAQPVTKAIRFGKLVDGTGAVLTNAVVVIEGDRIKSVSTSGLSLPASVEVVDLSRYTGIPGLIDMHIHLTGTVGGVAGPNNSVGRVPNQVLLRSPVFSVR
jgi:hypothetical protein